MNLAGQAICKDCGNGTLNNELNPQFELAGDSAVCSRCGSSHIDGELYEADSVLFSNSDADYRDRN